ncbi:MAG TPA: hypothetical protein PKN11_01955 [Anaerolineaceae bacterium]|nr:hypothetical protein [Anaerolineaceae bacterium]HQJ02806.1 hypothetical protein [Anaerolineaceae bacterium]HQO96445.1 hypothetical protein [Anaerolineaceae bacterium]
MEETSTSPEPTAASTNATSNPVTQPSPEELERKMRVRVILFAILILVLLGLLIFGVIMLVKAGPETAALVRDIFIIFMALVFLLLSASLVILIIQLATLINLLQNEIKPILESTHETVNTLKGTTTFLSNNLVEPVIKLNESLAGLKRFFDLIRPGRS